MSDDLRLGQIKNWESDHQYLNYKRNSCIICRRFYFASQNEFREKSITFSREDVCMLDLLCNEHKPTIEEWCEKYNIPTCPSQI